MNRTLTAIIAGLALTAVAAPASAAINARQLNQQRNIDAGLRSGKLTRHEAMRLKSEQRLIARQKAHMKARNGGHLTASQKRMIHQRQDAANRHILRLKHNGARG